MVHTYGIPTVCQYCKKLLKGLFKQGLQCKDCQYNAHKKCLDKVPHDCTGERQLQVNDYADNTPTHGHASKAGDNFFREEFDDSDFEDNPSPSASGAYMSSATHKYGTAATGAKSVRTGAPKTTTNAHNSPPELVNGLVGSTDGRGAYTDSRSAGEGQSIDGQSEQSSSSSSPSANIPLMRIVQSVKHTKKRGGQAIKEGWLVHYTSLDKTVKRYYWRLDSKTLTLTLFLSEQGSKYHKDIPLSEIQGIDTNRDLRVDNNFCFELKTASISYYVGQDPLVGIREEQAVRLPPSDSGIGSDIAKSWETIIRQAYMHVTNTRKYSRSDQSCCTFTTRFSMLCSQNAVSLKKTYRIWDSCIKYSRMKCLVRVNLVLFTVVFTKKPNVKWPLKWSISCGFLPSRKHNSKMKLPYCRLVSKIYFYINL